MYKLILGFIVVACFSCNNNNQSSSINIPETSNEPKNLNYQVVNIFPHDSSSYTEGLFIQNDSLFESGKSSIFIRSIPDFKLVKKMELPKDLFGEGTTVLNGKLYQLTYTEHIINVYDAKTWKKIGTYNWPLEGWGMTTDGNSLIVSTGNSNLYYLNPTSLKVEKVVGVSSNYGFVSAINELEYVDGFIYANIFERNNIKKIDPSSGKVVADIDLSNINRNNGIDYIPGSKNGNDVLNGIAYNKATGTFYITGKLWPKIFEIKLL